MTCRLAGANYPAGASYELAPGCRCPEPTSKKKGDPRVIAWLEAEKDACYTSAVVIAQLAYWVRSKDGKSLESLQAWLTRLIDAMHGRVHGFNASVAQVWADQERMLETAGQRMPVEDSYIAATARRHNLTIVTGNDRDFRRPGLKVFNPFKELPSPRE
jgi:toxin FitB